MGTILAYLRGRSCKPLPCRRAQRPAVAWLVLLAAAACFVSPAARAQSAGQDIGGQKLQLIQPLNGATVRETVPIRISRSVLPSNGYAAILIDGLFRSAAMVPSAGSLLYDWDTKAAYTMPDNPDQKLYTQDGPHTIQVQVFDHDGTIVGEATARVRVANRIMSLPDGVHLIYQWQLDEVQRYQYHETLANSAGAGGPVLNTLQQADLKFDRSVEDATGGQYLIRDLVLPDGYIIANGNATLSQAAYALKSKYRTVSRLGEILVDNAPFTAGSHFGFPIAQFPGRRVNIGDSWQSHMQVSLGWNSENPTLITGTAKLDDFEWQNGYPTAKIIETYSGPARFDNAAGAVYASNVDITRTIWFAYNSGRLIRWETTMSISADVTPQQMAAIGAAGGRQGGGGGGFQAPSGGGPPMPSSGSYTPDWPRHDGSAGSLWHFVAAAGAQEPSMVNLQLDDAATIIDIH